MSSDPILSLLGLALRGNHLAVGEEPVEAVARARDARVLLLAADTAASTCRRAAHFAEAGQCLWLTLPFSKEELGRALGRTSVALVAVTDIGLASAVVRRLSERDPARYGPAAERLDLKAQRAAERRAEQLAHEKNLRQGKRRPKARAEEAPEPPAARKKAPSARAAGKSGVRHARPSKGERPKPRAKADPYAHSRPVKKGKGSFPKKKG
jgi:ribosomal protein L7Ae-like RNA K-turn-binding protein